MCNTYHTLRHTDTHIDTHTRARTHTQARTRANPDTHTCHTDTHPHVQHTDTHRHPPLPRGKDALCTWGTFRAQMVEEWGREAGTPQGVWSVASPQHLGAWSQGRAGSSEGGVIWDTGGQTAPLCGEQRRRFQRLSKASHPLPLPCTDSNRGGLRGKSIQPAGGAAGLVEQLKEGWHCQGLRRPGRKGGGKAGTSSEAGQRPGRAPPPPGGPRGPGLVQGPGGGGGGGGGGSTGRPLLHLLALNPEGTPSPSDNSLHPTQASPRAPAPEP